MRSGANGSYKFILIGVNFVKILSFAYFLFFFRWKIQFLKQNPFFNKEFHGYFQNTDESFSSYHKISNDNQVTWFPIVLIHRSFHSSTINIRSMN